MVETGGIFFNMSDEINQELLIVNGLTKHFKGLKAVENVNLRLKKGEILGIIGPNGAGKTTIFNLLTGNITPTSGSIIFDGKNITKKSPDSIARLGIGRTFQNIRLFQTLSVLENVQIGLQVKLRESFANTLITAPSFVRNERNLEEKAMELLAIFNLEQYADRPALGLSYGDQRRLEIVRALALQPKLFLLDEPVAGMNPYERTEVIKLTRRIREQYNLTIIIVEHNMPLVMELCERIQVLNYGETIAVGSPEEIRSNPLVIEAYLGKVDSYAEA